MMVSSVRTCTGDRPIDVIHTSPTRDSTMHRACQEPRLPNDRDVNGKDVLQLSTKGKSLKSPCLS